MSLGLGSRVSALPGQRTPVRVLRHGRRADSGWPVETVSILRTIIHHTAWVK